MDRVYVSDIKKVINWYQILLSLELDHLMKDDAHDVAVKGKVKSEIDDGSEKVKTKKKNKKSRK